MPDKPSIIRFAPNACAAACAVMLLSSCSSDPAIQSARDDLRSKNIPFTQESLTREIIKGDTAAVELFIVGKINLNNPAHNRSPLGVAARYDKPEIAAMLIDAGADVDEAGYDGTPLCVAANGGFTGMAALLIDKGAEVDYESPTGTPLCAAAANGHADMVDLLIAEEADLDASTSYTGRTAMMLAAAAGHSAILDRLLAAGADPMIKDRGDCDALWYAVRAGDAASTARLLPLVVDDDGNDGALIRSFTEAAGRGDEKIVDLMIEHGFDVDSVYGDLPALCWAVKNRHDAVARKLISAGADVNAMSDGGATASDYALTRLSGTRSELLEVGDDLRKYAADGADMKAKTERFMNEDDFAAMEAEIKNIQEKSFSVKKLNFTRVLTSKMSDYLELRKRLRDDESMVQAIRSAGGDGGSD